MPKERSQTLFHRPGCAPPRQFAAIQIYRRILRKPGHRERHHQLASWISEKPAGSAPAGFTGSLRGESCIHPDIERLTPEGHGAAAIEFQVRVYQIDSFEVDNTVAQSKFRIQCPECGSFAPLMLGEADGTGRALKLFYEISVGQFTPVRR